MFLRFVFHILIFSSLVFAGVFSCAGGGSPSGAPAGQGPAAAPSGIGDVASNAAAPETPPSTVSLDPGGECTFCVSKCNGGKGNDKFCKDCLDFCKLLSQYGVDCSSDCSEGKEESSACKTCVSEREALDKASEPMQPSPAVVDPAKQQVLTSVQQPADQESGNKPSINIQVKKPYEEPVQIPNINFGH